MENTIIGQTQDLPLQKNAEMLPCNISSKKGFTLVELIIVITILTILGTISFISFQDYFADARDANRVTTIANIKQSLDLQKMKTRKYPTPAQAVSYTGGNTEIQQGVINKEIFSDMSNDPKDPGSGEYYTYSISENGKYYQLAAQLENEVGYKSFVSKTYADDYESVKVEGNYRFDPSFPSLIIVPSSYTSGSGIFVPSVCFVLDGGVNTLTTCNQKKSEMSLKDYDKSLVGYWDMETLSGSNLKDLSGNGNDGTGSGGVIVGSGGGLLGKGTYFDGINDYISIGNNNTLNFSKQDNFTITLFADIYTSNKMASDFFGKRDSGIQNSYPYAIRMYNTGSTIYGSIYGSGNVYYTILTKNDIGFFGTKRNILFTKKENIFSIYIDGNLYAKNTIDLKDNIANNANIYIGARGNTSNYYFNGIIDDVKIYNRALSDDEIAQQAKIAGF